jgi:FAD/FMN-containing dehydrogenase
MNLPAKNSLLVEVRNTAQAVERQVRDTSQLVRGLWANGMERISERAEQRQLWTNVTDFGYRPELNDKPSFTLKAGIVSTQSAMMLRQAKQIAGENGLEIESLAHAGHGILYITGQYAPEQEAAALRTISDFTTKVEEHGGSVVAEKLPLSLKQRLSDVWGNALSEGELKLMRGIKEKLDPNQTLNSGRFVNKI